MSVKNVAFFLFIYNSILSLLFSINVLPNNLNEFSFKPSLLYLNVISVFSNCFLTELTSSFKFCLNFSINILSFSRYGKIGNI